MLIYSCEAIVFDLDSGNLATKSWLISKGDWSFERKCRKQDGRFI